MNRVVERVGLPVASALLVFGPAAGVYGSEAVGDLHGHVKSARVHRAGLNISHMALLHEVDKRTWTVTENSRDMERILKLTTEEEDGDSGEIWITLSAANKGQMAPETISKVAVRTVLADTFRVNYAATFEADTDPVTPVSQWKLTSSYIADAKNEHARIMWGCYGPQQGCTGTGNEFETSVAQADAIAADILAGNVHLVSQPPLAK